MELLAKTVDIIAEDGIDVDLSSSEEGGDSDESSSSENKHLHPTELNLAHDQKYFMQFYKDMRSHTQNLSDLAFSLDQTLDCVDVFTREDKIPKGGSFKVSDPAQVYVSNVLDKFPNADPKLVKRLGQKNWERHQSIRTKAQEKEKAPVSHELEVTPSLFKPFSMFHDSGLGLSTATISAYAASNTSYSSFVSSAADGEKRSWRVPPLPFAATLGKPFTCDICGEVQYNIRNRVKWKIHVFSDLQPYICTFSDCTSGLVTFPRRILWAEHEFNVHRIQKAWTCPTCLGECESIEDWRRHLRSQHGTEFSGPLAGVAIEAAEKRIELPISENKCPFCLSNAAFTRKEFVNHVGRHMEEIALAALPMDDTSDNSDAESGVSTPHRRSLSRNTTSTSKSESQHPSLQATPSFPTHPANFDANKRLSSKGTSERESPELSEYNYHSD
jgi:hypothetical protein